MLLTGMYSKIVDHTVMPTPDDPDFRRPLFCAAMRDRGFKLREIGQAIGRSSERARTLILRGRRIRNGITEKYRLYQEII